VPRLRFENLLGTSQSFLRTLTIQCQRRAMQNVVAVPATAENLGIQRASLYRSAASSPPNFGATLTQGTRKLATRIFAAVLLSASTLYAIATDFRAQAKEQFNLQSNNSIEREIKMPAGRDVRVAIYTSIRSDCSSGPLSSIRLAVAPEHGTATVKHAILKATNLKQCLAVEAPAFSRCIAPIRNSTVDFSEGRKRVQHFHVGVSKNPAGGEAI
jgi:hypothetical protein